MIRDGTSRRRLQRRARRRASDLLYGIGGTPEGVISAAALKVRRRCDPGAPLAA